MINNPFDIAKLITKKFKKEISREEDDYLKKWADADVRNQKLIDELLTKGEADRNAMSGLDEERGWNTVVQKRNKRKQFFLPALAASLVTILSVGAYFYYNADDTFVKSNVIASIEKKYDNDVLPANIGAKIITADGTEIIVKNNVKVSVDGRISTVEDGVVFESEQQVQEVEWNTLVVPAANFFKMILPDGSLVWINANSELKFPSHFNGNERRIFLKGEAYFEVAKMVDKPFFVQANQSTIRVLGTHFNVSAYKDVVKTSLAEGSVEVQYGGLNEIIIPGQSAEVRNEIISVKSTDLVKDLAWKNNVFYFKRDNIIRIANQLKLWYDLEVVLNKDVSLSQTYSGEIRRDVNLSEVLKMLEFVSELDFKINQNKLTILNR